MDIVIDLNTDGHLFSIRFNIGGITSILKDAYWNYEHSINEI